MPKIQRIQQILENSLFAWLGLALILSIAGNSIEIPNWLQVVGRSHPLLLHFPIVLLIVGVVFFWLPNKNPEVKEIGSFSLLIGSNFAGITVIAGLLLAKEDYEGSELNWHQWMGIAAYGISMLLYFYRNSKAQLLKPLSLVLVLSVIVTGHLGANLTHGSDFLLAPIKSNETPKVQLADARVFEDLVQPILESKCQSCHKEGKIKGELRLDQLEGIRKGGKSGPFVLAGNTEESLLTQRIHLPKEEKKHMPPKNKEQLTEEEIEILTAWVNSGADFEKKVIELPAESDLFMLASQKFTNEKSYDFEEADPDDIAELNNFFRKVNPLYPESPALEVSYFGISAFDPNSLEDLKKVKEQVVKINLNKMPLEGIDLSFLKTFSNLEELQLNFSDLTDDQLAELSQLENLESLAISGNPISDSSIPSILKFKNLKKLFAWQTGLSEAGKQELKEKLTDIEIDFGFNAAGVIYELNAPKLVYDEILFQDSTLLEIKHPIKTVEIRYTLDGTEPDSINSPIYTEPVWVKNTSKINARVFAKDWIGSEEESILLFKSGIHPSEVTLLKEPNKQYKAQEGRTLNDQIKGKNNHTTGEWLGYQDNPFDIEVKFDPNKRPSRVVLSLLYSESAYIFPPQQAEVWVKEGTSWRSIINEVPEQSTEAKNVRFEALAYDLPSSDFSSIRIRLTPIAKLPSWHPGAGSKGWVFVDEVLLED
jgi:uncharacterized membrane protein